MRWVPVAARLPQRCAFIPFIGTSHPGGYFMGDFELPGGDTPYVSVIAVEQMAQQIGYVPPGDLAGKTAELDRAHARIAELETERDGLREQLDAVEVLKQAGYAQARKPGRPPKAKAVA